MKLALAIVAVSVTALSAATLVPAKDGAHARLTTPLRLGATPGATIRVRWTVETSDEAGGRRPFGASGMFVRLLSRTGATATTGFADGVTRVRGRYAARVQVPTGGIGGIRMGLRGWTNLGGTGDLVFPVENDPFTSPGGVRCDATAVRSTLGAFVRAYNRGDVRRLGRLFSRQGFTWYFATGPSRELRGAKENRGTLIPYFRERHRRGDRLDLDSYRFNGYDRARDLGHFQLAGRRRADDFRDGLWSTMVGKGALDCSKPPVTLALLLVGGSG
ncbi:MAG: hypothetical protein M3364_09960 [Actinomycetota bacterium]|nr:hypothetical protein [Actinomycetota bacterium]